MARTTESSDLAKQNLSDERDGQPALRDEGVVELLEGRVFLLHVLVAQLLNLELAERVVEVRRIVGAAPRLFKRVGRLLKSLLDKHFGAFLDAHALRVQLDADDVPAIPQERLLKLGQPNLQITAAEARVDHHLLGVVSPSFRIGPGKNQLARLRR